MGALIITAARIWGCLVAPAELQALRDMAALVDRVRRQ